jgi:hypothetical protein
MRPPSQRDRNGTNALTGLPRRRGRWPMGGFVGVSAESHLVRDCFRDSKGVPRCATYFGGDAAVLIAGASYDEETDGPETGG